MPTPHGWGTMPALQWTAAAIRIMALWMIVTVVVAIPGILLVVFDHDAEATGPWSLGAVLRRLLIREGITLVVAAVLWSNCVRLARLVWPDSAPQELPPILATIDLQRAVFVAFGIYLVVQGLPHLTEFAFALYSLPPGFDLAEDYSRRLRLRSVGVVVQMLVGLFLIFGSGRLVRFMPNLERHDERTR